MRLRQSPRDCWGSFVRLPDRWWQKPLTPMVQMCILTDLAIETGIPVAVHVSLTDLAAAGSRQSMRDFITSSLGSCNAIVAADVATAELLGQEWLSIDSQALDAAASRVEVWPLEHGSATAMLSLCHRVLDRRREAGQGFFAARE